MFVLSYNARADANANTLPLPTEAMSLFSGSNTLPSPDNDNIISPLVIIIDASKLRIYLSVLHSFASS